MTSRFIGSGRPIEGGLLATAKQDFKAHVEGGDWRHTADQIDLNYSIGTALTVQDALDNISSDLDNISSDQVFIPILKNGGFEEGSSTIPVSTTLLEQIPGWYWPTTDSYAGFAISSADTFSIISKKSLILKANSSGTISTNGLSLSQNLLFNVYQFQTLKLQLAYKVFSINSGVPVIVEATFINQEGPFASTTNVTVSTIPTNIVNSSWQVLSTNIVVPLGATALSQISIKTYGPSIFGPVSNGDNLIGFDEFHISAQESFGSYVKNVRYLFEELAGIIFRDTQQNQQTGISANNSSVLKQTATPTGLPGPMLHLQRADGYTSVTSQPSFSAEGAVVAGQSLNSLTSKFQAITNDNSNQYYPILSAKNLLSQTNGNVSLYYNPSYSQFSIVTNAVFDGVSYWNAIDTSKPAFKFDIGSTFSSTGLKLSKRRVTTSSWTDTNSSGGWDVVPFGINENIYRGVPYQSSTFSGNINIADPNVSSSEAVPNYIPRISVNEPVDGSISEHYRKFLFQTAVPNDLDKTSVVRLYLSAHGSLEIVSGAHWDLSTLSWYIDTSNAISDENRPTRTILGPHFTNQASAREDAMVKIQTNTTSGVRSFADSDWHDLIGFSRGNGTINPQTYVMLQNDSQALVSGLDNRMIISSDSPKDGHGPLYVPALYQSNAILAHGTISITNMPTLQLGSFNTNTSIEYGVNYLSLAVSFIKQPNNASYTVTFGNYGIVPPATLLFPRLHTQSISGFTVEFMTTGGSAYVLNLLSNVTLCGFTVVGGF